MRPTRIATGLLLILSIGACSAEITSPRAPSPDGTAPRLTETTSTDTTTKSDGSHMIGGGG